MNASRRWPRERHSQDITALKLHRAIELLESPVYDSSGSSELRLTKVGHCGATIFDHDLYTIR